MSNVSGVSGAYQAYYTQTGAKTENVKKTETKPAEAAAKTEKSAETEKKYGVKGRTIGDAKLTKKASEYYESLKKKFSNLDFVLVSEDKMDMVKANPAAYGQTGRTVVLINEEKLERMANDEEYRQKYEGIIGNAANQMNQMIEGLKASGANVESYGMTVNDNGTATYFAALKESSDAQKERIETKIEQNRADKKAQAKKAAKEEQAERLENRKSADKSDGPDKPEKTVTFSADSIEELMSKISAYSFENRSNAVRTDAEKSLGQSIDFSA